MLNVIYGVLAMLPTTFGIAGYVLVSHVTERCRTSASHQPACQTC
jgi:hypothetical protein